ncbi:Hypothetical predicted protein [Octopus vulgaris]|uniref:Uncharacterized protein n=1 Tax=Octopus vulgaris TaxID=6645 RepID=A0AA36BX67_OCTVU|nr:Hypothetical predicted protein [Octopus vulgaris]
MEVHHGALVPSGRRSNRKTKVMALIWFIFRLNISELHCQIQSDISVEVFEMPLLSRIDSPRLKAVK